MTSKCGVSLGLDENTHDGSYATHIDAAEAIDSLSNADHKKLVLIARYFWNLRKLGTDWGEPEDLLFEAVLRTLEGERRWRHSTVSMVRHLDILWVARVQDERGLSTPGSDGHETLLHPTRRALDDTAENPAG